ncbi:MAG: MOSC domain-containing protein [Actinomycetales bacterium]|nr:MOSC domain-containing protein [Actinomycetales bacterium]
MTPRVRSTNIAVPKPAPGSRAARPRKSGIDKRPVAELEVFAPADGYGHGSGVAGDLVGNSKHHGGAQKAVYAYAREELAFWESELGRPLADGQFGENLTTEGIDLESLLVNQPVRIGTALLEVSLPRTPCATFAAHLGEHGWIKRFAAHGRCGTYFRVVEPGRIRPGDAIVLGDPPAHDIDIRTVFAAALGDDEAARRAVGAACLPPLYHERFTVRLASHAGV